ncbi:MAG: Ig domain protein group 2 domain protein [Fibrobacteres bacterium]|nr:Ig domain protein group 2 domain protein [Fibrobacterota bacterium]
MLAAAAGLAILNSCRKEFDSPYMPGSPGYAGDDWTRDGDGNGVADSIDKYSPTCNQSPKVCLENSKVISKIATSQMVASNMLLWLGDSAQAPRLAWSPAEASLRGYVLASSDTTMVKIRDGMLLPVGKGSAQIAVSVPGAEYLNQSFIAQVVAGGVRVSSISAKNISVMVGKDTAASLDWIPQNADIKEYSLVSDQPLVAKIVDGPRIRGVFAGKANITVQTMDGSRKTAFSITVTDGPQLVYTNILTAETMYMVKGGNPETPILHWSPSNVSDKMYKLVPVEDGYVTVTKDSLQVKPLAVGTTMVLAKALDGSGKATEFTVIVAAEAVPVTGITAEALNLVAGADAVPPKLTWIPKDATNRKYSLVSGDQGVAIASSSQVMPISMGTSLFTVTTEEGGFTADFTVTVGRADTAVHVDSVRVQSFSMPTASYRKPVISWYPANAGNQSFTLASDDSSVVRPEGELLFAVKVGTANVTLTTTDGSKSAQFKVTSYATEIPVTQIGADSMSLTIGQEMPPTVSWTPSNATNLTYSLISPDTNIVAIRGGTRISAKAVGSLKVTIKSGVDGPSGVFQVIVNASAVKLAGLIASNFTMNVSDPARDPIIAYQPSGATNKAVTLKTSATSIISINANKITALAPGKAPLTVTSVENPNIAAVCTVTVAALVRSVSAKDDTLRLGQADRAVSTLLTWDPPNATDKSFALKSNDTNIVRPSGMTYKAVGGGKTTVIVRTLDGSGKSDTFNVWVKIPVTSISAKDLVMKTTDLLWGAWPLMTISPANATEVNWYLIYTYPSAVPAPSGIVKIDAGWQLSGMSPGTAQITVISIDNQALRDTFTVTVTQPVTGITAGNLSMKVGDPDNAGTVSVLPANATNKAYTLTSATPSVASIVANKVHAVSGGSAVITATSSDGGKVAQFTVTVAIPVVSISVTDAAMRVGDADKDPAITWNPAGASNKGYTLSSSNTAALTIVANKLHAAAAGTSNVTVTTSDGGKTAAFAVTVTQGVNGITVADMTIKRPDGDRDPVITWNPSNASNKGYTLTGGNAGVATVVGNKIHPVSGGAATMTVTTADGGKAATFTVTVVVPLEGIVADDITMSRSDPDIAPNVTYTPADASNKGYSMVSSDPGVATIEGGKISPQSRGTTNVTITSNENPAIHTVIQVKVTSFGF